MTLKFLIIRNFASEVDSTTYNLQEVGLGKELVKQGFDCDIVYFSKTTNSKVEKIYSYNNKELNIFWMSGFKIFNNSIFTKVLKQKFLDNYNYIITTEYNQIMTYLLSVKKPKNSKLILYHGPYMESNKLLIRNLYDTFCLKSIIKNTDFVFSKTNLAKNFLISKGFKNPYTLGVGVDTEKFENNNTIMNVHNFNFLKEKNCLLYIGKLEDRRNIIFTLNVFNELRKTQNDLYLILVGDGEIKDVERYFRLIRQLNIADYVIHFPRLDQEEVKVVYELSTVFIFPSSYEIFGMVLLESMFLGLPIVSSVNGGSELIIKDGENGLLIEQFDEKMWTNAIQMLIENESLRKKFSLNGKKIIKEKYLWEEVSKNLFNQISVEK